MNENPEKTIEHDPTPLIYGKLPVYLGQFPFQLPEVMYWLYLPVVIEQSDVRVPIPLECCLPLIDEAIRYTDNQYQYVYLSARKGYASPDNPLNRPGWHCDGFGTSDINFVWWDGPGTRFANQAFRGIVSDHNRSLRQFDEQVDPNRVVTYPEHGLYVIDPSVVHATPVISPPGCLRSYVKVSCSDHKYNLENNSHNWLFDYDWPMHSRDELRNDPHRAQRDYP